MAISVTKPTVGASTDTWGATINTALDTIVDGVNGTSGTVAPNLSTLTINGTDVTATAAEINKLDGLAPTTAELNILDGVTATTAELNVLDGVTATTSELNILDGVTATAAEINKLDGVTATTAELNILDGVTATAAELNIMDGVTATTAELNYVDGVTSSIQTQLDAKYEETTQLESAWEAGTSTTESLVSPAKVKAAAAGTHSLATNGYQVLPSGLYMQWGQVTGVNAEQLKTVSFPIAFPNAVFSIMLTPKDDRASLDFEVDLYSVAANPISLSQFTIMSEGTLFGTNKTIMFMALGR